MKNQEKQSEFRAKGLFLSGFQSLAKPTYVPLKPLTLLYGPNSAGKSAVVDAIGLYEDIAAGKVSQIVEKTTRWQYRELDDLGNWPRPGDIETKEGKVEGSRCLRVGVEFVVPSDWFNYLSRDVMEFKVDDFGQQPHLEKLGKLVGHTVHVDAGIWDLQDPSTIRVAVDYEPVFELRYGDHDDGRVVYWDSSYRREGADGFDEEEAQDGDRGPLLFYPGHSYWHGDYKLKKATQFAASNTEPGISRYLNIEDGKLNLYGVILGDALIHARDGSDLFQFRLGKTFCDALDLRAGKKMNRSGKRWPRKTSSSTPTCETFEISELLAELSVICKAILQLGAASLRRVHVDGSRPVLAPTNMTLREDENAKLINPTTPSYLAVARRLAYDETKSQEIRKYLPYSGSGNAGMDHRVVNRWLTSTLPSLRGYKLYADAFKSESLSMKRVPFNHVDACFYHLYLLDAQGRPHEFEDVGSGFSYLFPILIALWESAWSIIEQPELHLHPAAQCDLADVFIAAKNVKHAALIETHSENLILRILRRIRETTEGRLEDKSLRLKADEVAVLYFHPQSDGTTEVKQLRISRNGDFLDRWPTGFFEERSRELFGE